MKINKKFYNNLIKAGFDRQTILFMIAFERKYTNIYASIMASINIFYKNYGYLDPLESMVATYILRWEKERPEVQIYPDDVKIIYTYCYKKYESRINKQLKTKNKQYINGYIS